MLSAFCVLIFVFMGGLCAGFLFEKYSNENKDHQMTLAVAIILASLVGIAGISSHVPVTMIHPTPPRIIIQYPPPQPPAEAPIK